MNEIPKEIEKEETFVDVRIFHIPKSDFDYWMQIVRAYGNNRQTTFRMLLDCYLISTIIGKLHTEMKIMEDRIQTLEQQWRKEGGNYPKTFGVK